MNKPIAIRKLFFEKNILIRTALRKIPEIYLLKIRRSRLAFTYASFPV